MRNTLLLIFIVVFQVYADDSYSQNARLTLNLENVPVAKVLVEIENKSEFYFLFNAKLIDAERKVSISMEDKKISEILTSVFSGTDVNFMVYDKQIILSKNDTTSLSAALQQVEITGTVTDKMGNPLQGVTVIVKGTSLGVLTDVSGKYALSNVPQNAILIFSFVGIATQEIPLNGRTLVNVTLVETAIDLAEIVIVGYGTQTKKTLSGAIINIQSDALTRSVSPTISTALIGKIAGVTTRQAEGRPGSTASLQIRNMGIPLYIIDNIPGTESDFNNLEANDIESISILKDASAAIYGLRASNGVVLVTTKLGKTTDECKINISAYYGLQDFTRYPQPANAYQYMVGLAESAQNQGQATSITQATLDKWKEGKKLPDGDYRSMDYLDYMINPAPQTFINASAAGGSNNFNYYFSVGNLDQRATIRSYYFERSTIQANLEAKLAKRFKIGTKISGRIETRHTAGVPAEDYYAVFNAIMRMWPIERPYANDNPLYINNTHSININPGTYRTEITGWNHDVNSVITTKVYAEYEFGFGLKAKGMYSYQYNLGGFDNFEWTYDAYTYDKATDTYNVVVGGGNKNPSRTIYKKYIWDKFSQFQLSYDKNFGKHAVSAVVGYERSFNESRSSRLHSVPKSNYIPIMLLEEQDRNIDLWNEQARASYIGRFNYYFNEKYLVEFLGRYDGSYMYSSDKRWGFFPGVSIGWRISEEPFFKGALGSVISDFKLRASYGQTGSEIGIVDFDYLSGFNWAQGNYIFNGNLITGIQPRGLPVTNLSWVNSISTNFGIDFSLFESKLSGQFDIFERRVTGIPAARYDVLLPSEVGYSLPNENLNSYANYGAEGMVLYNGKAGSINYSVGINSTFARKKSLHTYKPRFGNSYDEYRNSSEMRWDGISWGYHIIGQFQSQEEIDNYPVNIDGVGNRTLLPGDLIYEDLNGDKIINGYDQKPIGYATGANPYVSFGLNCTFDYKGFNLLMDFAGATMQTFIRDNELKIPFAGSQDGNSPDWLLEDRWHHADPFDATSPWIPGTYPPTRKNFASHSNFSRTNDFYLTNIKYFRIKTLEIGYTYPLKFIKSGGVSTVRIYTNISNLFSIDNVGKKLNIDPEITNVGGLVYPQTRVINFGLILSL